MKIVEETLNLLEQHRPVWEKSWQAYATGVQKNLPSLEERRAAFHERGPLRLYTSINDLYQAKRAALYAFSLRFKGREVGQVRVSPAGKVTLVLHPGDKGAAERLRKVLGCDLPLGEYLWGGKEAAAFRKHFGDKGDVLTVDGDQGEKTLEAFILDEMQSSARTKFEGTLAGLQPVRLGGSCRFQMVVPLSASASGLPVYKTDKSSLGRIDILARIVAEGIPSNQARLGILELKKDHTDSYKTALAQSIIYAVCLRELLRSKPMGAQWWEIFGYRGALPPALTLYAVAMVPGSLRSKYLEECRQLGVARERDRVALGSDTIQFGYAFFSVEGGRVRVDDYSWQGGGWRVLPE